MRNLILKLHRNNKGAIAVLTLLTIWCLVALLAMLWNTTEEATRRQHLQTTADSAAHSAALWSTRVTNAVAAQNMVICQDAAAQTIWTAVPIADASIKNELNAELAQAQAMLSKNGLQNLRNRLLRQLGDATNEHDLAEQALANVSADIGEANFPDDQTATTFSTTMRQAQSALDWVDQTYMNGAGAAAGRPGPPGPGGQGIVQLIENWDLPSGAETQILTLIINYINTVELPDMQGPDGSAPNGQSFETRTGPATSQALDQTAQNHEQQVYQSEQALVNGVPDEIEAQRAQLATFYKANITLATLQNDGSSAGPATVYAPVVEADQVDPGLGEGYTDSIRAANPGAAAAAGLPLTFDIDPINPQTDIAEVWHPNVPVTIPELANGSITLNCNIPGGWGHIWAMPIERYYNDRVWNDQSTLNSTYMQYLDNARNNRPNDPRDLAWQIRQILGLPDQPNIADLPGTIPDDQPDPSGVVENILVLPKLTAPAASSAKFRTLVDLYNQHGGKYTGDVRGLRASLISYIGYFNRFTQSFAVNAWTAAVGQARDQIIQQLGTAKTFMVLATYKLRWVPEDLRDGLQASAQEAIRDQIVNQNVGPITQQIVNGLIAADPNGLGGSILDASYRRSALYAQYIGTASSEAIAAITPAAQTAAEEIAHEWISRPWPYEITPPTDPVPPWRGMGKDDRQQYFTVIAAAQQTPDSSARFVLSKILGTAPPLLTYAQAETFNWMEYNTAYGGSERFDQVSWIDYYQNGQWFGGIPVPRCWRLSTVGGWSWQPRLSVSDALPQALQVNPELQSYFATAGITGGSSDDFDAVNLH